MAFIKRENPNELLKKSINTNTQMRPMCSEEQKKKKKLVYKVKSVQ